jgi:hypothetical protein
MKQKKRKMSIIDSMMKKAVFKAKKHMSMTKKIKMTLMKTCD